jgi:hypothetical protein
MTHCRQVKGCVCVLPLPSMTHLGVPVAKERTNRVWNECDVNPPPISTPTHAQRHTFECQDQRAVFQVVVTASSQLAANIACLRPGAVETVRVVSAPRSSHCTRPPFAVPSECPLLQLGLLPEVLHRSLSEQINSDVSTFTLAHTLGKYAKHTPGVEPGLSCGLSSKLTVVGGGREPSTYRDPGASALGEGRPRCVG